MGYSPWGHKESDMAEQLILLLTDASGFPESSIGKESVRYVGDPSLIPGLERYAGEGIGYSLLYSWASLVAQLIKNLFRVWETWA